MGSQTALKLQVALAFLPSSSSSPCSLPSNFVSEFFINLKRSIFTSSGSFELCELVNEILSAGAYEPWVQDLVAPAQVIRNSLDVCMFHPMFKQRPHFNTVYTLMGVMQCIPCHLCCFIRKSLGRWKCKSQYIPPLSSVLILKLFLCLVLARPTEPYQLCARVALPRNCQQ